MLIDNTLKNLYSKENIKDTHNESEQDFSSDFHSTAKKKKPKIQDGHKGVNRKFEPLLKKRSKKNLFHETFNYQGQGSDQNIPSYPSRNTHQQNISYSKTVDVPVMQQPWAMDTIPNKAQKPRKEVVHKVKDNSRKVRRVKKSNKNPASGYGKYDSHFQPSSLSSYISSAMKSTHAKTIKPKKKVKTARVTNYEVQQVTNLLKERRDRSKEKNMALFESKIPRISSNDKIISPHLTPRQTKSSGIPVPKSRERMSKTRNTSHTQNGPHYLVDTKCSKNKLGKIIKTIANEEEWSNSLRDNNLKRHKTPTMKIVSDLQLYNSS